MDFIGVELHKKVISICVVSEDRKVVCRKRLACVEQRKIEEWFAQQPPFQVVVEATASYQWFVKLVEPIAERVVPAHPNKLRAIAESTCKSDKLDAQVLATFLALGMIREAHRPAPRLRSCTMTDALTCRPCLDDLPCRRHYLVGSIRRD